MPNLAGRLTRLLIPLLFLAACGGDHGLHRTTRLLNNRLQEQLAPDIGAGAASLQPLPNGARVTLLDNTSRFPNDVDTLAGKHREVQASVIEGLLDLSLIRIALADTSALPPEQQEIRVRNVTRYFQDNGLGLTLLPEAPPPPIPPGSPAAAPGGLTITVLLVCPARRQPDNWGYAPTIPSCY